MSEIPDDIASQVAAFLECPAGHPEDCTGCAATAKRILTALRADPELAAKALGGEVELRFGERKDDTGQVWDAPQWVAEKITSEDVGWSIVQRDVLVVLYPWREVTE